MTEDSKNFVKNGQAERLYSQTEIGDIAGTNRNRVSRWINKHGIQGKPRDNKLLYPKSVLDSYLEYISTPNPTSPKGVTKYEAYEATLASQQGQIGQLKSQIMSLQDDKKFLKEQLAQKDAIIEKLSRPALDYEKLSDSLSKAQPKPQEIDYDKLAEVLTKVHSDEPNIDIEKLVQSLTDNYTEQTEKLLEAQNKRSEESKNDQADLHKIAENSTKQADELTQAIREFDHSFSEKLKQDKNGSWFKRFFG